ncbi:membrane-anchored junction protein [Dipodomys spectabilis]|uniref:membrane-anchored junction protein n=1 Tax=Dipodomys spectabilis TaxID=105255 RepID=UPI001C53B345|nr:membrane-anchored junction protein [Dipodomys spectabilis]
MTLKPFTYPFPETRFFHAGSNVYKFKIRYGNSIRGEEIEKKEVIIQELEVGKEKKAAEATMRKRKLSEEPGSPSRPEPHRAKMETSSQGLNKKKPPVESRRNRERETQQEWQETPAFDIPDIQEQDSKWGYGLPEPSVLSVLQNTPPPPKKQGTSGFFGFLSTLFPFRYFFKKSNQ